MQVSQDDDSGSAEGLVTPKREASVTLWVRALEEDHPEAAKQLFDRYFERLVSLARKRLGVKGRRVVDEEDIAMMAFYSFVSSIVRTGTSDVADREHLWRLLVRITECRVYDEIRRLTSVKRGSGNVRGESVFVPTAQDGKWGLDALAKDQPSVDFADAMAEEFDRLLKLLNDENLCEVAQLVLAGHSTGEIAKMTNRTQRTIQRRIQMIQDIWTKEQAKLGD